MCQILPTAAELELIAKYLDADVRQTALRLKAQVDVRPQFVLRQIEGRQIARRKLPEWAGVEGLVFPQHLSMEQCSSEATARYKAHLVVGDSLADLTGGLGVDFSYMARMVRRSTHVEMQPELSAIVAHNMPLLGLPHADVVCADGVEYLQQMTDRVSTIFLDPARRDANGRKTVLLADCTPDVSVLESLLVQKADRVVVKLSPMLDIKGALASLHCAEQLHIVAVGGECKEMLLVLNANPAPLTITAVNLMSDQVEPFVFTFAEEADAECAYTAEPLHYLYEPNSALMKAGAYRSVAARYGVFKLHPSSHLYTSAELVAHFPGRRFAIEGFAPLGKQLSKGLLAGISKANIAVRNFPLTPDELRKKLKLSDGGDVYLFGTTAKNGDKIVVKCRRV